MGFWQKYKSKEVPEDIKGNINLNKDISNNNELAELKKQTSKSNQLVLNKKTLKSFAVKAIGYVHSQSSSRERFSRAEYNLSEIKEATEADSYIKIALTKYSYLIYKAGTRLKSDNQEAINYILQRFKFMSFSTSKPMDILFQEIADDLVRYSNAFLLKARVDSIPGIKLKGVFSNKVVGGYFRIDPASIKIKRDEHGNVLKYIQGTGSNQKEFNKEDVVHLYMDKDANNAFGTPRIIAALEDVKLLRKIEGNIVALIHRFSMPLYQYKIGVPTVGFQGTDEEISKAKMEMESSSLDGLIITNEKTEIKAIGAEGTALNAVDYLKYFEDRVFSALGVSASQMGRGGAKQDSESMEAQVHDTVKYIQRIMSIFIEEMIINELLLEGGYNPFINEQDTVRYRFEEISLETQIKKENHNMLKYQSNMITFEEARRNLGIKDIVEDEERLYNNMIEKKSKLEELDRTAEHQMVLEKLKMSMTEHNSNISEKGKSSNSGPAKASSVSSKKDKSDSKYIKKDITKTTTTLNRPTNQHGTTSVKMKEFTESHNISSKKSKKQFKDLFNIYENLRNDINKNQDIDLLIPLSKQLFIRSCNQYLNHYSFKAMTDATKEINSLSEEYKLLPSTYIDLKDFEEEVDNSLTELLKDIKTQVKKDSENVTTIFESYEYRLRFLIDFVCRKVYWYSYLKTGEYLNISKAYIIFSSDDDAEGRNKTIDTKSFSFDDIPAYHSFCNCEITYNKKKAGEKNANRT